MQSCVIDEMQSRVIDELQGRVIDDFILGKLKRCPIIRCPYCRES